MPKATRDNQIIVTDRTVLRLQRQIAKYRRQIKKAKAELRHERKILRALAYAAENGQTAPSRLTGGATGYAAPKPAPKGPASEPWTAPEADAFLASIGVEEPV
jgi:hypothetical protein